MRARSLTAVIAVAFSVAAFAGPAHAGEWFMRALFFWKNDQPTLTQPVARRAVREALVMASDAAIAELSRPGGFSGRAAIPLPSSLAEAQSTLRTVGRSGELDDLQARINRAAEASVAALRPTLSQEIATIVLPDALALVRGQNDSATRFLRQRVEADLMEALTPVMARSLSATGAGDLVESAARTARAGGRADDWRQQLTAYTAKMTIARLFETMAVKEAQLRADANRQMSEDLRRAFAGA